MAENQISPSEDLNVGNKLTDQQLEQIKKYLPRGFAKKIAENYAGITKRQVTEVVQQRSPNPVWNSIVWAAIVNKLIENNRQDLVEAINKRLSFCNSLLDI